MSHYTRMSRLSSQGQKSVVNHSRKYCPSIGGLLMLRAAQFLITFGLLVTLLILFFIVDIK